MTIMDQEQEHLWDSVQILSKIDSEKATTVLKTTIEKTFHQLNIVSPILSRIRLSAPSLDHVTQLREIEKKLRNAYVHQEQEKTYEYLVDYIDQISELSKEDSIVTRKKLYASLLAHNRRVRVKYRVNQTVQGILPMSPMIARGEGKPFYTSSEAAEKLGLSDQTIRRMCDKGKFSGAYKTDGGHWRIPPESFITTPQQDKQASEALHRIDLKNQETGDVDEFDL